MASILSIVGLLCGLAAFGCWLMIIIDAFKNEVLQGILSLCVPFYILYYAFAKFEHEKKGIIIAVWLLGGIINAGLQLSAAAATGGGAGM